MRTRWLKEARLEAADSARFYRDIDSELGASLIADLRERISYAAQFPEAGARVPRTKDVHVRRLLLERFRYAVVFALLDAELVIVAVHHQRRKPGYWKPRLAKVQR